MNFLNEIEKYFETHEFSMEMLNFCRTHFQYGGFGEKEEEIFKKMMIDKVSAFFPDLPLKVGEVFGQLCIDRGILEIKDILFIEDAIFVEKEDRFSPHKEGLYIDFIGTAGNFKYSSPSEFLYSFSNISVNKLGRNKLAQALHKMFAECFNNSLFPEFLSWEEVEDGCPCFTFAINCDENEILEACEKNKQIHFTIISRVANTNRCRSVELAYIPDQDVVLKVLNCKEDNIIRLSDMINSRKEEYSRKLHK